MLFVLVVCSISMSAAEVDAAWLKKFEGLCKNFTKIGQLQRELNEMDKEVAEKTVEAVNAKNGILKVEKNEKGMWMIVLSEKLTPFIMPEDCFKTPAISAPANK